VDEMLSGSAAGRKDGSLTERPRQAALHSTMTSLVSDKGNYSRSGNKFYKTSPPGEQA
jgi:hypothetical protein